MPMAKKVKRTNPSTPQRKGVRESRPENGPAQGNTMPAKPRVSMGTRDRTGFPLAPDEQERKSFGHLLPVHQFLSKYPYDLNRISLSSNWEEVTQLAGHMQVPEQIQLFTLYVSALFAIADETNDDRWRQNALLAEEWVTKMGAAGQVPTEPVTGQKAGAPEESDREFMSRLRRQIPPHGEELLKLDVREGDLQRFRITQLTLEKMTWNEAASQFYLMWWVSGTWKSNNEILIIPLPLFLSQCKKEGYHQITSKIIRTLWSNSNVPGDAVLILNFNLVSIACGLDPEVAIAWGAFGRIDRALHLKGLWPSFDGDWASMKRFADMLAQHRRINYFGYCYLNFPGIRRDLIKTLRTEPLPSESAAKEFVESCGDLWLRLSRSNDEEVETALKEILLSAAKRFEVFPSGHFEREAIERFVMLFRALRPAFLNYVIKTGKQEVSGMQNIEVPDGIRIEPFHSDLVRAKRNEDWERGKIEKTIKWCEIELEHSSILTPKSTLESRSSGGEAKPANLSHRERTPRKFQAMQEILDNLPRGPYNGNVQLLAQEAHMSESNVRRILKKKNPKDRRIRGVPIHCNQNGKRGQYSIRDSDIEKVRERYLEK